MRFTTTRGGRVAAAALLALPFFAMTAPARAQTAAPGSAVTGSPAIPQNAKPIDGVTPSTSTAPPSGGLTKAPATGNTSMGNPGLGNPRFATSDSEVRASRVIGSAVYNEQKQKIGTVSELLIGSGQTVGNAVISVGGFLGIDSKLIEVPYRDIRMQDNRLVMPGASKNELKRMPAYRYKTSAS